MSVISYGLGTLIGLVAVDVLILWFVQDVTQKKHSVLRNYPVIGRLRYFFERQGEYFRQYFFLNDREEMPFNRATRAWVYRESKDEGGIVGFGSTTICASRVPSSSSTRPFPCSNRTGSAACRS